MQPKRKSLEAWVREAFNDPDKEGELSAITLVHKQGTADIELHTTKFGGKNTDPKELANMFHAKAESYAQDLPGVQTFCLLAFYGDRNEPQGRQPFTVNGITAFEGLATEGPDDRGSRQQGMRLTEAIVQSTFRQIGVMFQSAEGMIANLQRSNVQLMTENREYFTMVKDLLVEKSSAEHEREQKRLEFERSTAERKKWLSFAPALINTICGKEVFPQSTADSALVETIGENLKEEDIQKLAGLLPPELWGPLAQRFEGHILKKQEDKRKEAAKLLTAGQGAVSAGTNGGAS